MKTVKNQETKSMKYVESQSVRNDTFKKVQIENK